MNDREEVHYWLMHVAQHRQACTAAGHPYPVTDEEKELRTFYEQKVSEAKAKVVARVTGVTAPDCDNCARRSGCGGGFYTWGGSKVRCSDLDRYQAALHEVFDRPVKK